MNEEKNPKNIPVQENNHSNWTIGPAQKPKIESRSVVSWGVGNKVPSSGNTPSNEVEPLFPEDIMDQVNAGTIANKGFSKPSTDINDLEVLDEDFSRPAELGPIPNQPPSPPKEEPSRPKFTPVVAPEPKNMANYIPSVPDSTYPNNLPNSAPIPGVNDIPPQMPVPNDPNWMSNQPLSGGKLGVSAINAGPVKDVEHNGKFFNTTKPKQPRKTKVKKMSMKQKKAQQTMLKTNLGLEEPRPYIDETQLLKNYVQTDLAALNKSVFSFTAFIFKGSYLIHRKLFIEGFIITALECYILLFLPFTTSIILYFTLSFLLAFIANPYYLFTAKLKIKTISKAKKNRKKNQGELNRLCLKSGGDAFLLAFLVEVTFLGGTIYLSMYQYPNSTIHQSYTKVLSFIEEKSKPVYDGVIDRLPYNVEDNLHITIPEEFSKDTGKIYRYHYIPNGKEEVKSCAITISHINKFTNPTDYLTQYQKVEKIEGTIQEVMKGDLTWYLLEQEKRSYSKHLNATSIKGQVILLEYNSGYEVEEGVCENFYNNIFNSISLKKKE